MLRSIYVECVNGAGTIEWYTLNDTFVTFHPYVGTLYNAPAGDLIFVTNTDNSTSAALHPGGELSIISSVLQLLIGTFSRPLPHNQQFVQIMYVASCKALIFFLMLALCGAV